MPVKRELPSCCPNGHEYSPENTYIRKAGSRECRACKRAANIESKRRLRTRLGMQPHPPRQAPPAPPVNLTAILHRWGAGEHIHDLAAECAISWQRLGIWFRAHPELGAAKAARKKSLCGAEQSNWPEETIARLRVLWAEGHSTAEIGRRLDVSKNAVIGKAHRLDLPERPSPIRAAASGQPRKNYIPKRPKVTLPPLPAYEPPPAVAAPVKVAPAATPRAATSILIARPLTAAQLGSLGQRPPARAPRVTLKADAPPPTARDCQFILNDAAPWRFCARTDMKGGTSYCHEHAAICLRKAVDRREIADAA